MSNLPDSEIFELLEARRAYEKFTDGIAAVGVHHDTSPQWLADHLKRNLTDAERSGVKSAWARLNPGITEFTGGLVSGGRKPAYRESLQ